MLKCGVTIICNEGVCKYTSDLQKFNTSDPKLDQFVFFEYTIDPFIFEKKLLA